MKQIPYEDGYYVYLIKCSNDALYCGWTTNVRKRFYQHSIGKGAKYTRAYRPLEFYYMEPCETRIDAMKREYAIKQMTRKEKELLKINNI